jgi:alpha,alpha-trehalose phosphorylase
MPTSELETIVDAPLPAASATPSDTTPAEPASLDAAVLSRGSSVGTQEWGLHTEGFDVSSNLLHETLFALGNGYLGQRAAPEEGLNAPPGLSAPGTFLNGFHDIQPIVYPENAYGLARRNEFMVNVADGKRVDLWIDDERFDPTSGTLVSHERRLDFREGVLRRSLEWISPRGKRIRIRTERLVSLRRKHVFAQRYSVEAVDEALRFTFASSLDTRVGHVDAGGDPRVGSHADVPALEILASMQDHIGSRVMQCTPNSRLALVSAIEHDWSGLGDCDIGIDAESGVRQVHRATVQAGPGAMIGFVKFGAYHSSRDFARGELIARSTAELALARADGFDALVREQVAALGEFWRDADIEIGGDSALQQGIRFNVFHLLQSAGRDGLTNVAAKGVTGEGYEGHYFWDTEIYVFPFFLATQPAIARRLLEFRCALLPKARERARQMAHPRGALYPWRTIAGEECSSYFPAGTAQVHINADIAHALRQYVQVTGDMSLLVEGGAEMLFETARIWMDVGHHDIRRGGAFCIHEVTGPDEYKAMVDNNFYTNAMAQAHLRYAADISAFMARFAPAAYARITAEIELDPTEPLAWRTAADAMYLPVDSLLGVHPQDDTLLHKPAWPFPISREHKDPLLLNYHPLVIYRHQICKQADVVLALVLRPELCDLEQKRRDFNFYESITVHDSSLSASVFGILASEVGEPSKALGYFMQSARMDLDDLHGNTGHGAHIAAMAGAWLGVVHGFAGLRWREGVPSFRPTIPSGWSHFAFKVRCNGGQIAVHVDPSGVAYRLIEGALAHIDHADERLTLDVGAPFHTRPLAC